MSLRLRRQLRRRFVRRQTLLRRYGPSVGVAALLGAGVGATLMYAFDPRRGRRRRALVHDKAVHMVHQERQFVDKAVRDLRHRGRGLFARLRHLGSDHPSDDVLLGRVRSALGRHVSHPSAIEVDVLDGEVTLRGPILADEVDDVVHGIKRVRGVRCVENQLDAHETSENVPALQGAGFVPRPVLRRDLWPPAYRGVAIVTGTTLGVTGVVRGGLIGSLVATSAGLLALRGIVDMPLTRFFGLDRDRRGMDIQKTITVHRPVRDVFDIWTHPENFPQFMEHAKHVTMDENRQIAHWEVEGPGGTTFSFDTETTEFEQDRLYGWQTLEGARVRHAGRVRFEEIDPQTTRIHVRMTYQPPAGAIGHAVAKLFGMDPKHALDDDLLRFKSLLEDGKATAHGHEARLEDLH
jgi:uncharacterized membrane protein